MPLVKKDFINRLHTIEGQIRGIEKMIEEDRYCDDILIQLAAVSKSIRGIGKELLKNHLSTCVVDEIKNGNTDIVNDVIELMGRMDG